MATALHHALELFVQELHVSGPALEQARLYAAQTAAIVAGTFGMVAAPVAPADALRACFHQIQQLKPASEGDESAALLSTFVQRLSSEVGDPSSTLFHVQAPALGQIAEAHRMPKHKLEHDEAQDADGAPGSALASRAKRARKGGEEEDVEMSGGPPSSGGGTHLELRGSDAYTVAEMEVEEPAASSSSGGGGGGGVGGAGGGGSAAPPHPPVAVSGGGGAAGTPAAEPDSPYLQFRIVKNDGTRRNLVWLTQVKNIFAAQLPKMPREYIARLVFDRKHRSMLVVKKDRVVGGICFRPFLPQRFAEIAFCAITASEQVKGYGTRLMNHTKEAVKQDGITHFLTYADNYAIGYFKKQGFTKHISLPPDRWVGYIKDYDGGTLMEAVILSQINYLEISRMIGAQRSRVTTAVNAVSHNHVVYPSLHTAEGAGNALELLTAIRKAAAGAAGGGDASSSSSVSGGHGGVTPRDLLLNVHAIPGVKTAGWTQANVQLRESRGGVQLILGGKESELLRQALMSLTRSVFTECPDSWPFHTHVDEKAFPDYKKVVANPKDLTSIASACSTFFYRSLDHWLWDMQLMTNNARVYNRPDSEYVACASRVDAFVQSRLRLPHTWIPGWATMQVALQQAVAQQAAAASAASAGPSGSSGSSHGGAVVHPGAGR